MKMHPWPTGIACFFACVIGLNTYLATLAASGYQGILDEHPYVKGLQYDTEKEQLEAFVGSGWRATLRSAPASIVLRDKDGSPIRNARILLQALRPNSAKFDRELHLEEREAGVYSANEELARGRWLVSVVIDLDGREYRIHELLSTNGGDDVVLGTH
jgi:nitrogen fixation protein FixH